MTKLVVYKIKFCNSTCPHFYHNYEDFENVWCSKLDQKVYTAGLDDMIWDDFETRPIPEECPLEDTY